MNSTTRADLARAKARASRRGAALVEAAVVIPVMLVFLGLTMFIHNSYDEKLASQTSTRAQVLYYGSHNCEGQAPNELAVQLGTKTSGGGAERAGQNAAVGEAGDADRPGQKLGDDTQAGLSRNWNLTKAHRQTNVGGSAVQDRTKVSLSAPVRSNSEVACNEKRFDSAWTAVFGFIGGYLRSGAGIL